MSPIEGDQRVAPTTDTGGLAPSLLAAMDDCPVAQPEVAELPPDHPMALEWREGSASSEPALAL